MFTGIVEELGEVVDVAHAAEGETTRLTVHAPHVTTDAKAGDSIAVNGVCLTVVDPGDARFSADVIPETLDRSTLGALTAGARVNLERAARVSDRLSGHIVQGHVDGTAEVLGRVADGNAENVRFSLPTHLAHYVVEKGSITVDGVSLTVAAVDDESFTVGLIPTTREVTTLGRAADGAFVNLEVDVIAKYVERMLGPGARREAQR
ncbi:riboflavin synthase [Spiractinospora alimapuensis]|uniref:riboflavin synthase n=1 Tax=Spiractinospora alimapuensis TaxID=2820884 RepID=UPI001EEC2FB9|nr:riboflavin synthase [Spiractinospora alimapuensis]QVQ54692.1 riboflavin synthase [Spiractinospora alimapuensis]